MSGSNYRSRLFDNFTIWQNGNVGVGTTIPRTGLDVAKRATFYNGVDLEDSNGNIVKLLPILNGISLTTASGTSEIAQSILFYRGDMRVHNGSTEVRFPVSATSGDLLTVDSSSSYGIAWKPLIRDKQWVQTIPTPIEVQNTTYTRLFQWSLYQTQIADRLPSRVMLTTSQTEGVTYDIRLWDVTNNTSLGSLQSSNIVPARYLIPIQSISSNQTVDIELHAKQNTSVGKIVIEGISFVFV